MALAAMPLHTFISYSSADKLAADEVCLGLEQRGVTCWMAPRDIRPGAVFDEAIVDAITDATCVVLLLSEDANESPYVKSEVSLAFARERPIYALRIEDVQPGRSLQLYLGRHQWTDAFPPPIRNHVDRLAAAILSQAPGALEAAVPAGARSPPLTPPPKPAAVRWFTFVLIVEDVVFVEAHATSSVIGRLCDGGCSRHQRVKIVTDDQRTVAETVVDSIARSGVEVETAEDGDEVALLLRGTPRASVTVGMVIVGLV